MLGQLERQVSLDVVGIIENNLPWDELSGSKIIVTGASGFLGYYLVRVLLALNERLCSGKKIKVIALIRNVEKAKIRFQNILPNQNLELVEWDLNKIAVPRISCVDYIFHAASQASPKYYSSDPVGTLLPNTIGTAALLTLAQESPKFKSFLFVSSSEVYGKTSNTEVLSESDYGVVDPTQVRACYSESKRMGEAMCVSWAHQFGIETKIVRPFHTYGPGLTQDDGRVFADFAFDIVNNRDIEMSSDGSAVRAFCYVSDAILGMFFVLFLGQVSQPYNVANDEAGLSVLELAELLVSLFPEKNLKVKMVSGKDQRYLKSQYSKLLPKTEILRGLGWKPKISPAEGFLKMIEAQI